MLGSMEQPRQPSRRTVLHGGTSHGGTNIADVGTRNRALVLDLVRRTGPVQRVALARGTGLSAQTVSNISARLVAEGLVRQDEDRALAVVPSARAGIGVHLDPAAFEVVLVDLTGTVLAAEHHDLAARTAPGAVLDVMAAAVGRLRAEAPGQVVDGITVAVPGPIDTVSERLRTPAQLRPWSAYPLAAELAARTGAEVHLEKDAIAGAFGEAWTSPEREDLVAVHLGSGVSAAAVASGEVVRGATGNAGEFGGMPVYAHGRWTAVWEACQPLQQVRRAVSAGVLDAEVSSDDAAAVRAAYARMCREPAAAELVTEGGAALGSALAHVVELLDVPRVTIGGSAAVLGGEPFLAAVRSRLRDRLPRGPFAEVAFSTAGVVAVARGAACSAIARSLATAPRVPAVRQRTGGTVHARSISHPW